MAEPKINFVATGDIGGLASVMSQLNQLLEGINPKIQSLEKATVTASDAQNKFVASTKGMTTAGEGFNVSVKQMLKNVGDTQQTVTEVTQTFTKNQAAIEANAKSIEKLANVNKLLQNINIPTSANSKELDSLNSALGKLVSSAGTAADKTKPSLDEITKRFEDLRRGGTGATKALSLDIEANIQRAIESINRLGQAQQRKALPDITEQVAKKILPEIPGDATSAEFKKVEKAAKEFAKAILETKVPTTEALASFEKLKDGTKGAFDSFKDKDQFGNLARSAKELNDVLTKTIERTQQSKEAAKIQESLLKQNLIPTGAGAKEIVDFQDKIKQLGVEAAKASLTPQQVEESWKQMARNSGAAIEGFNSTLVKSFQQAIAARERLEKSAKSHIEIENQAAIDIDRVLERFNLKLRNRRIPGPFSEPGAGFNIPLLTTDPLAALQKSDPRLAEAARRAIQNLNQLLIETKINSDDVARALEAVKKGDFRALTGGAALAVREIASLATVAKDANRTFFPLTTVFNILQAQVVKRFFPFLFQQFRDGIRDVIQFETALLKVQVAITDFSKSDAQLQGAFGSLSRQISQLSTHFGQTRKEVSDTAFEIFSSNIFKGANTTDILNTSLKLARVTFSDASNAARTLTTAIGSFGFTAGDTEKVAELLFATVTKAPVSLTDLERLLNQTAVSAKALGVPLLELLGRFVSLRQSGVPVERAITTISNVFNRLITTGTSVNNLFAKEGFDTAPSATQVLGLNKILEIIAETAKKGTGRLKEFAQALIGTDGDFEKLTKSTSELVEKSGQLNKVNDAVQKQFVEQIKRGQQNLINIRAYISEGLAILFGIGLEGIVKIGTSLLNVSDKLVITAESFRRLNKAIGLDQSKIDGDLRIIENGFGRAFATIRSNAFQTFEGLRSRFFGVSEDISENFKTFAELTKKILQDVNNFVKEQQKFNFDVLEDFNKKAFEKRISILPPQDQPPLLNQKLNDLDQQRRELLATGNIEDTKRANKLLQEQLEIGLRIVDLNNQIGRQNQTRSEQLQKINDQVFRHFDQLAARASNQKIDETFIRVAQKTLEITEKDLRTRQFADPITKANLENELRLRQLILEHIKEKARLIENPLIDLRDKGIKTSDEINRQETGTKTKLKELQQQLQQLQQSRLELPKLQTQILTDLFNQLEKFSSNNFFTRSEVSPKANEVLQAIQIALSNLSTENLEEVIGKIQELKRSFNEFNTFGRTIANSARNALGLAPDISPVFPKEAQELFDKLKNIAFKPVDNLEQRKEIQKQIDELKKQLGLKSKDIDQIFSEAAGKTKDIETGVKLFNSALEDSIKILQQISDRFDEIGKKAKEISIPNLNKKKAETDDNLIPKREFVSELGNLELQKIVDDFKKELAETNINQLEEQLSTVQNKTNNLTEELSNINKITNVNDLTTQLAINKTESGQLAQNLSSINQNSNVNNLTESLQNSQILSNNLANEVFKLQNVNTNNLSNSLIEDSTLSKSLIDNLSQLSTVNTSSLTQELANSQIYSNNITSTLSQTSTANVNGLTQSLLSSRGIASNLLSMFSQIANIASNIVIPQPQIIPVEIPIFTSNAPGFATGGYVDKGPLGVDRIPAWLTRGEFVVNAQSTDKFYEQLILMNRGVAPQFFTKGGYVGLGNKVTEKHTFTENNIDYFAKKLSRSNEVTSTALVRKINNQTENYKYISREMVQTILKNKTNEVIKNKLPQMFNQNKETLINKETTKKFYNQLIITNPNTTNNNDNKQPNNNINVGDINIHVTGNNKSPEAFAKEVGPIIAREIRKGTFNKWTK